ncbi:MAG: T9SS type A sorting domain-containing protein [Flavobacteriales bacterium]|nr:T9SS type A sorting domain-containing protein [Flavobacteriales bacterium]
MKKALLTAAIGIVPLFVHAQAEWFEKLKPTVASQMGWAHEDGVAFSLGEYILFGMGRKADGEVTGDFMKYHPATNTFEGMQGFLGLATFNHGAGGVGFSIGEVGYAGLGGSLGFDANDTIFRYTLAANSFWAMEPLVFPGGPRFGAISFVIGDKAYIGGGLSAPGWNSTNTFWEYSPATGWLQRASLPAAIGGGVAFALDGAGYVIRDNGTTLWRYDPVSNTWSTQAVFPGGALEGAVAFTYEGKGYVGTGYLGGTRSRTFHAYDPASNTWSEAEPMWDAWGRTNTSAVSHNGKAYVICGNATQQTQVAAEIWELGPPAPLVPGTWVKRPYLPAAPRDRPFSFTLDGIAYLGGGNTTSGWSTQFFAYDPLARRWNTRASLPAAAQSGVQAAAAVDGLGYVLIGTDANNFWVYDPANDTWAQRADMPGGARSRPVAFGLDGKIYVGTGMIASVRQNDLWAYDPQSDSWEQRANYNTSGVHSAAAFTLADRGCICGGNLNGSSTATSAVRCYDPVTDTWASAQGLQPPNNMQTHTAIGLNNRGYRLGGTLSSIIVDAFHEYDPNTNAWTVFPTTGGGWRFDATAFAAADRIFLSCGRLNPNGSTATSSANANDLWEYIPLSSADDFALSGRAYYDADLSCTQTTGDIGAPNLILEVQPGGYYASTNAVGEFIMDLPPGQYTLAQTSTVWLDHCNAVPQPFEVIAGGPPVSIEFPDTLAFGLDVGIALSAGAARVGFQHQIAIALQNHAPLPTGGATVQLVIDPVLSFLSATPAPTLVAGNTITWEFPDIPITAPQSIQVTTQVPADIGLLGTVLLSTASVSTVNTDGNSTNNSATVLRTITAAYDPNDKLATTSSGNTMVWLINEDEWIDYTIRFQNTGTDTAFTVIITDTLPPTLDPGSIIWGAASHAHSRLIEGQGTMKFIFPNILLPDSNVNEPLSHGFVTFRIRPRQPVLPGTTIENIANIYFDFNPPVITEPSVLMAEFSTGIQARGTSPSVFPNPANEQLFIRWHTPVTSPCPWAIFSGDGRMLFEGTRAMDERPFDTSGLVTGLYFLRVFDGSRTFTMPFTKIEL